MSRGLGLELHSIGGEDVGRYLLGTWARLTGTHRNKVLCVFGLRKGGALAAVNYESHRGEDSSFVNSHSTFQQISSEPPLNTRHYSWSWQHISAQVRNIRKAFTEAEGDDLWFFGF